jgi:hypothetical protein
VHLPSLALQPPPSPEFPLPTHPDPPLRLTSASAPSPSPFPVLRHRVPAVSSPSPIFGHLVLRYELVFIQGLVLTDLHNICVCRCTAGTPSRSRSAIDPVIQYISDRHSINKLVDMLKPLKFMFSGNQKYLTPSWPHAKCENNMTN